MHTSSVWSLWMYLEYKNSKMSLNCALDKQLILFVRFCIFYILLYQKVQLITFKLNGSHSLLLPHPSLENSIKLMQPFTYYILNTMRKTEFAMTFFFANLSIHKFIQWKIQGGYFGDKVIWVIILYFSNSFF